MAALNVRIDAVLSRRLEQAIDAWCHEFSKSEESAEADAERTAEDGTRSISIAIKPLVHEVRIRNQVIYLDPPIEAARQEWLDQFQDALGETGPLNDADI